MYGADNRNRTYDLRITNALLYQLSYVGVVLILARAFVPYKRLFSMLARENSSKFSHIVTDFTVAYHAS